MLHICLFMFIILKLAESQSMYYATNSLELDCLNVYFYTSESPEIVQYCLNSIENISIMMNNFTNQRDRNYTFNQLRQMNVTSNEIFLWTAALDVAEKYQFYLLNWNNSHLSNNIFYNCTLPWFGSYCQYQLKFKNPFDYESNAMSNFHANGLTCYEKIECNRGSSFLCLDWREICDGRIDCLNGGIDESQCFNLEVNECDENEYRCHNGLCISKDSSYNDQHRIDCLDQSDGQVLIQCPNSFNTFDQFSCEEHTCRADQGKFSCGDGQCVDDFEKCQNGRHRLLIESISFQGNLSENCWISMVCLTKVLDEINGTSCEKLFSSNKTYEYRRKCEQLIEFPTIPVLFGHVRFLYRTNDTIYTNSDIALAPDYVCYDQQLCEHLIATHQYKNYTCRHGYEMGFELNRTFSSWTSIIDQVKRHFHGCKSFYDTKDMSQYSSLYKCKNSSKYISKHRINDGISDCYLNDDETDFASNCSLYGPHRFQCEDENNCRSPVFSTSTCSMRTNVDLNLDDLNFYQICDGISDLREILINGRIHSDETDCQYSECNNIYTRCDGFWNCPNGADEFNCFDSICPQDLFTCVSSVNQKLMCISIDQRGNEMINCLSQKMTTSFNGFNYEDLYYLNETVCFDSIKMCNSKQKCPPYTYASICKYNQNSCKQSVFYNRSIVDDVYCHIGTTRQFTFSLGEVETYSYHFEQTVYKNIVPKIENKKISDHISHFDDFSMVMRCNQGILVNLWSAHGNNSTVCFCPPNYYGKMCQYQSDRVSLTLNFVTSNRNMIYHIVANLIIDDDSTREIISYDQFVYVSQISCSRAFSTHLLFSTDKNFSKTYSIHIDVYDKSSLTYIASWTFNVPFLFLPVNQVHKRLIIPRYPTMKHSNCPLKCQRGICLKYINKEKYFCQCETGWLGKYCDVPAHCDDCSLESLCVGSIRNRSICVCELGKFGSNCLLKHQCPTNYCHNNGQCMILSKTMISSSYVCICSEQFYGSKCEFTKSTLQISFNDMKLLPYVIAYTYLNINSGRSTSVKAILHKFSVWDHSVKLYSFYKFQMVILQNVNDYYLAVVSKTPLVNFGTSIDSSRRCSPVTELFDSDLLKLPRIQRVKYYHSRCQLYSHLKCFYDEVYMCLCTLNRQANCFQLSNESQLWCKNNGFCENGGKCLEDNSICPLTTLCICTDCFFGDRCQFYAKGIGLTLDDLLRYEIRPNEYFSKQPSMVKWSAAFTMVLFVIGILNSFSSLLVFHSKETQQVGCGIYLFASSIISGLIMIMLLSKYWFIVVTHINPSIHRSIYHFGCLFIEPILKLFLHMNNWLNACVAIERAANALQGHSFNKVSSRRIARWVVFVLPFLIFASNIHESFYRRVFDDPEEDRMLCVTLYSSSLHRYATIILLFHFVGPFCANLFSSIVIIYVIAHHRKIMLPKHTYLQHVWKQIKKHKQLIISPMILIILSFPRLVISLLSECVKTANGSWLYLCGYFLSFVPPAFIFVVFVLPSSFYRQKFTKSLTSWTTQFTSIKILS